MGTNSSQASSLGVRWDAVLGFQSLMARARPGSRIFEIADKAVDLALRPSRIANDARFFRRNVWRNAAHMISRKRSKHSEISLDAPPVAMASGQLSDALVERISPLDLVSTDDLQSKIAMRSELASPGLGRLCTDGMAAGDSVQEIAADGSTSLRTVKRTRARVRAITNEVLKDKAA